MKKYISRCRKWLSLADDRYIAADAVEAVEVEYEELPVVIDPETALEPDAPVLREDLAGKTEGAHGPRDHHNHIFTWEAGDKSAADDAFCKRTSHCIATHVPTCPPMSTRDLRLCCKF